MVIYGYIWLYMIIYGYIWFYMVIYGYIWLYMAIFGFKWFYMVIYMVIYDIYIYLCNYIYGIIGLYYVALYPVILMVSYIP